MFQRKCKEMSSELFSAERNIIIKATLNENISAAFKLRLSFHQPPGGQTGQEVLIVGSQVQR